MGHLPLLSQAVEERQSKAHWPAPSLASPGSRRPAAMLTACTRAGLKAVFFYAKGRGREKAKAKGACALPPSGCRNCMPRFTRQKVIPLLRHKAIPGRRETHLDLTADTKDAGLATEAETQAERTPSPKHGLQ